MADGPPDFLIVGTPRSGTTLAQRLAGELEGVRIPHETHFFRLFAPALARRQSFPLTRDALLEELRAFAALETSRGLRFSAEATARRLNGRVETMLDLFGAIVRELAGEAQLYGEKTPSHLRWWRELSNGLPKLRTIAVVRDPRAVVASYFAAWGHRPHAVIAERWALDQREVAAARRVLGDGRCLVVRYEEIVAAPDVWRRRLSEFLGVPPTPGPRGGETLALPWETWKARAGTPITTDRVDRWREALPADIAADVTSIARREMALFGYAAPAPPKRLAPTTQWLRYRYRAERLVGRAEQASLAASPTFG